MRQRHLGDLSTHFLELLDAFVETCHNARLEAFAAELLDQTDLEALQITLHAFAGGRHHRARAFRNGRGITLVVAADHFLEQGRVEHSARARADLVERGSHGDRAKAGDAAVGRLDADGTGQRTRLADGTAGIGTQSERSFECSHGSCRATAGTARDALGIPRIVGGLVGGVFGGGALRELIEVGLAQQRHACGLELLDDGGIVRGHPAFEDLGGCGGFDALGDDHVFDGDRHTGEFRQCSLFLIGLGVEGVGLFEGLFAGYLQEGLDARFGGFDDFEVRFDQLAAGNFLGLDLGRHLSGGKLDEFAHVTPPLECAAQQTCRLQKPGRPQLLLPESAGFPAHPGAGRLPAESGLQSVPHRR